MVNASVSLANKQPIVYTGIVTGKFHLLFIPHEKNNHRALLLHPNFLAILIGIYLLNQFLLRTITLAKPGVLGYSSEITSQKVVELTNLERQKLNLSPLEYSAVLSVAAQKKAEDMFAHNYWAHTSPQGKTPWDFFKEADYHYSIAGENLAKDFYDTDSMMKAWMKSPTHKANIINQKYQQIGIAVVNGVLGGVKTTLVVQHFGTPLTASVQSQPEVKPHPEKVLSSQEAVVNPKPLISPLAISKAIGGIMFGLIISVLILDGIVAIKKKTHRLSGSNSGHIGFLVIILMFMLLSHSGSIF